MKEILKKLFFEKNIGINDEKLNKFVIFYDFLIKINEKTNLTRIVTKEETAEKHFLDSVSCLNFIPKNANAIDVGSGGGFPSIPLKIMRDDINLTMVDSVQKKVDFLNEASALLCLKNCNALHERVEDLAHNPNFRERFSVCTARAVAPLNTLVEYCAPFVKLGGIFIAFKGSSAHEELEHAKDAINILGFELEQDFPYKIASVENHLLVFRKLRRSPNQYPRRNNKPRKEPLKNKNANS